MGQSQATGTKSHKGSLLTQVTFPDVPACKFIVFSLLGFSLYFLLFFPWFQNKLLLEQSSLPQRGWG